MKNLPALSWLLALLVWLGVYPAFAKKEGFMLRLIIAGILSLTALILLPFNTAAFDSQLVQELIIKSGIRTQTNRFPRMFWRALNKSNV